MKEKVSFYLLFVILIILEIALINFAFPTYIKITLMNGLSLFLFATTEARTVHILVRHISLLWALIGLSLAAIVFLLSQMFRKMGFIKISIFSRTIAIYSSLLIILFFILIFFFSSFDYSEYGCTYKIANFFIDCVFF